MLHSVEGMILRGVGGFYEVETPGGLHECRARGIFRRKKVTPMAGDRVRVSVSEDGTGILEEILPRRTYLLRPPVANLDQIAVVVSVCEPDPNPFLIDRLLASAVFQGIEPILVLSKIDLRDSGALREIYRGAGIRLCCVSSVTGEGVAELRGLLPGKITVFAGNTGVGKSSLLNAVSGGLNLKTGEISRRLGRGRHTTRQTELFRLREGGYVADTPGFSSLDSGLYQGISRQELASCFREFRPYLGKCQFTSCSHTCEKGCAVRKAVEEGRIHPSRHRSYIAMYREMKDSSEWRKRKKSAL